jgi:hypothetical protein
MVSVTRDLQTCNGEVALQQFLVLMQLHARGEHISLDGRGAVGLIWCCNFAGPGPALEL